MARSALREPWCPRSDQLLRDRYTQSTDAFLATLGSPPYVSCLLERSENRRPTVRRLLVERSFWATAYRPFRSPRNSRAGSDARPRATGRALRWRQPSRRFDAELTKLLATGPAFPRLVTYSPTPTSGVGWASGPRRTPYGPPRPPRGHQLGRRTSGTGGVRPSGARRVRRTASGARLAAPERRERRHTPPPRRLSVGRASGVGRAS